jgi:hypothetical protein
VSLLHEFVALEPKIADYQDMLARALAEIEAAMDLDEGNEEARRMLDRTKHPTRMQTLLKRIFS